jgi:hypothetical protein
MAKYFKRSEYDYVYGIMVTQTKASANLFLQEYNKFRQTVPAGSPIWNEVEEQVKVSGWLEKAHRCQSLGTSLVKLTAVGYRELPNVLSRLNEGFGYLTGVQKLIALCDRTNSEVEIEKEAEQIAELDF